MIIKLCGISEQCDFQDFPNLDMIGYNFYPKSKRYISDHVDLSWTKLIPKTIKRVGVFVDVDLSTLRSLVETFDLDYVQLHGSESTTYCEQAKYFTKIIKAFAMNATSDIDAIKAYEAIVDYLLFDTQVKQEFGGTGQKFDWHLLEHLDIEKPFLIAGGIGPEDAQTCLTLNKIKNFAGIDINSKFEYSPAHKDMKLVNTFVREIKASI